MLEFAGRSPELTSAQYLELRRRIEEANAAVHEFCRRFREEWIVERLGCRTPAEA